MDNDIAERWRNFPLDDWTHWLIKGAVKRGMAGRAEHGDVFQGDPLTHAFDEVIDLAYYLYVAKRQLDAIDCPVAQTSLNALARMLHSQAKDNGWHDQERTFGDEVALIHSEVSEALEEYRTSGEPTSPEVVEEFADIIIRVLDVVGKYDIDIAGAISAKIAKNKERPYRHGGKAL